MLLLIICLWKDLKEREREREREVRVYKD